MKQLKAYSNLFLLAVVLISSFSTALITASFKFNQPYIVSQLCQNKDKPAMKCNGKCYLSKQLKEDSEDSNKGKKAIINKQSLNWVSYEMAIAEVTTLTTTDLLYFDNTNLLDGYISAVYHPPSLG